ncbi:MAG TPA: glycosyltransferase family 39 protein [Pirellulales bacterium]|jgi:4-amino-4-deoxy-L-arabinose transferase-like glycosyltransferase|nr:glycosyltransferase family 39 protein [Pirellulales bacterium]
MRSVASEQLRHQLLILLTAGAVFFISLGSARLWDEDETEYSRCAREMMARGDWVVPTFNHHPWLEKPVLVYWLMIGSFRVFGPTEFAARFPSAICALGTALVAYQLGRRLFRPQVGLWAGLILATSLMFVVVGRAATHDSTMIFFTTLSLLAYVVGMGPAFWKTGTVPFSSAEAIAPAMDEEAKKGDSPRRMTRFRAVLPKSWWSFVAMYVPLGLAVMAKGPLGVLLPIAALGMFVWISGSAANPDLDSPLAEPDENQTRFQRTLRNSWRRLIVMAADFPAATWAMRPLTLAAIVLAIAAPWYVLAGIRTHGEFWRVFIWEHNVQYILHSKQGHAGSALYFYPLALVVGFFPWTIALGLGAVYAARHIRRRAPHFRACALAAAWCLTWFVVMSLVGTKLPHYIVPAYPMLAVIAGLWIADWIAGLQSKAAERWIAAGFVALGVLGIVFVIGLPPAIRHWAPGQPSFNWLGLVPVIGAMFGWTFQRRRQTALSAATILVTGGALFLGIFGFAAPRISTQQSSVRMNDAVRQFGTESTAVGVYRAYLPGLIYYADRPQPIVELYRRGDVRQLLDKSDDFLVITDLPGLIELRPQLPVGAVVLEQQPRFLKGGELLVVGRLPAAISPPGGDPHSTAAGATRPLGGLTR